MQSAGLRTRGRTSMAPSVDETASIVTLHTVADETVSPASRSRRTTFIRPGQSQSQSQASSAAPSLIIQKPDSLHPSTAGNRKKSQKSSKAARQLGTETNATTRKAAPKKRISPKPTSESDDDSDDLDEPDVIPPKFTIDLSKPPNERYNHVAQHFTPQRIVLEKLFRQIAKETFKWDADKGRKWGQRVFRKLPSAEEDEEVQGIAHVWGVEKFLLVAFNVLLDGFMGCTSGGARVRDPQSTPDLGTNTTEEEGNWDADDTADARGRMLHFRTLDWSMEPLRKLVCQYEYIARPDGPVVARQVTYFGFVGVLTGLRKGLSISLNFRPCHDGSSWWKNWCFRAHQIFVLLGWRQSISSMLRECLLPSKYDPLRTLPTLVDIERDMPAKKTTAAYLIFSDGSRTTTMEKDHRSATTRSASDFIVALNHDVADESATAQGENPLEIMESDSQRERVPHDILSSIGMDALVADSRDRKGCLAEHWKNAKLRRGGQAVQTEDVIEWMRDPSICNDETHYGVVMDPLKGEIVWLRRWLHPLELDDKR